jgi:hypothetical protein
MMMKTAVEAPDIEDGGGGLSRRGIGRLQKQWASPGDGLGQGRGVGTGIQIVAAPPP